MLILFPPSRCGGGNDAKTRFRFFHDPVPSPARRGKVREGATCLGSQSCQLIRDVQHACITQCRQDLFRRLFR